MGKKHRHLSRDDRRRIHLLKIEGLSLREIGLELGFHKSSISREIRRNSEPEIGYTYDSAHSYAMSRRVAIGSKIQRSKRLQSLIRNRLVMGWSPEVIAGRLKLEHSNISTSHESIYKWVYDSDDSKGLIALLRHRKSKRGKRRSRSVKYRIEDRVSIHERPKEFSKEFGHFEGDTIVFKGHIGGVVVLQEKASKKAFVEKTGTLKSDEVMKRIYKLVSGLPEVARRSITFDNGSEFQHHHFVHSMFKEGVFFCDPYASWQKGGVENLNFVLRKFIRKGSKAQDFSAEQIDNFAYIINNTPRKSLGYLTPNEKFHSLMFDQTPKISYIANTVALRL